MISPFKRKIKTGWLAVFVLVFFSCSNNTQYFEYEAVNESGWMKDSVCKFEIPVNEINKNYNLIINTRNTGDYPYQNLWLFVTETGPDSVIKHDTINFYLADEFGRWLGNGVGHAYNMPVLYRQKYKFLHKGLYKFEVAQGMRDSLLVGINDVGFKVEIAE